jgi:hypothetical protein
MVETVDNTPVIATPAPAAVVETPTVAPVTVEAPKVETAPVVEPVKVEPVVEAPKPPETVLAEALDKDKKPDSEVKPEEKKTEEGKSEEPAPPPVYDAFKLPDDLKPDTERMKGFTDILGQFELDTKADHAKVQELGQKAMDLYVLEVKNAAEDITNLYKTTWEKQKITWKEAFLKDPEIGGNRFQTTVDSALGFIRTHGGTAEQQTEFRNLMESSGLGNHPAMIRLLANAGKAMSEGAPLAATKPVSVKQSKVATLYGEKFAT